MQAPQPETCAIRLASEQAEELTLSELSGSETTFIMPSVMCDRLTQGTKHRSHSTSPRPVHQDYTSGVLHSLTISHPWGARTLPRQSLFYPASPSPRLLARLLILCCRAAMLAWCSDSSSGSETPFGARTAEGSQSKSSRDTKLVGKPKKKASKAALREFEKRKRGSLQKKGTVLPPPESAPARRSWQARIPPLVLPDPKEEPLDL